MLGTQASEFEKIALDIAKLVERKNHDYGSAFDKLMDEYPEYYPIRITEKLNRFKSVTQKGAMCVTDESLHDTVKDIIGYSLLYLNYVQMLQAKETQEVNEGKGWGTPTIKAVDLNWEQVVTPTPKAKRPPYTYTGEVVDND